MTSIAPTIDVEPVSACPSCGHGGTPLYTRLHDHTFGTPGEWTLERCASCGLIWLSPRPTEDDIGKVYETYYTHKVTSQGSTFRAHVKASGISHRVMGFMVAASRRLRNAVLSVRFGYAELSRGPSDVLMAYTLGLLPGVGRSAALEVMGLNARERGRLLDVGCGNGAFLSRMKSLGWQCIGIETDEVAARFAREHFGLDVRQSSLTEAAFAEGTFDVVTLSHVIEHVHSPIALLLECRRILKPGGKLVVLTPNTRSLGHRIFGRAWRGLEPPRHLHAFHPQALQTYTERAGMSTQRLTTEPRMMRSIWYASRLIQRAERGRHTRNTVLDYLIAHAMQPLEALACRMFWHIGEEIMLVAVKPESAPARG
ncbi:MAG: class I SAM-dependent methyltransferase [Burkholderiales bacterium]|jgi:2-polyprenyl-3-methyl-5-hydroxy-6-metoxy-1,4-benzoquinol methylase|nr:class I SAM-dependent methyltransferase [Burkholderiales bacterium]